jgi:polysaccharide pyruvyl transferase WcaK-like protein
MATSFFSINTQFENVGDALINREMIQLAKLNSDVFLDLSRCPADFISTLGLTKDDAVSVVDGGFLALCVGMMKKRLAGEECYYFLSPGGYFGEVKGLELLSKYVTTFILFLISMIGVKVCHVGVSYERLGSNFSFITKLRSKFLHRHIVRDEITAKYLTEEKIKFDFVGADLAFNLFENDTAGNGKEVFVSFRCDQNPRQFELAKQLITKLNKQLPPDIKMVFYSQVERDSAYMQQLYAYCNQDNKVRRNCEYISVLGDIEKSLDTLKRARYVISNRLHVLLMASSEGALLLPCILDGYNKKIEGIMGGVLGHTCFDMSSVSNSEKLLGVDIVVISECLIEKEKLLNDFRGIYEL